MQKISPCLWFNTEAQEAAEFYTAIFPSSRIVSTTRYEKESAAVSGQPEGSVLTVVFEIEGQQFTALNGGPAFTFSEAISFIVVCETQDEVDRLWQKLTENGGQESQCGWLKDKFGVSWQIVPTALEELLADSDTEKVSRVMKAMLPMNKLDIETLKRAAEAE